MTEGQREVQTCIFLIPFGHTCLFLSFLLCSFACRMLGTSQLHSLLFSTMCIPRLSDRLTEHTCLQHVFLIKSLIGYFCSLEEAGTEHAEQVEKQQQRLKPKNVLWGIRAIAWCHFTSLTFPLPFTSPT